MERVRRLAGIVLLSIVVFAIAWAADLLSAREMGLGALALGIGSGILGFLMIEFEEGMKAGGIVEFAYAAAVLLAYAAIAIALPQATQAAGLFVLFLAAPLIAIHVRKLMKK